ncbi:MAG: hypothetical protein ABIG44_08605 [Planctomycetota bacterium]
MLLPVLTVLLLSGQASPHKPPALLAFERARCQIYNADILCEVFSDVRAAPNFQRAIISNNDVANFFEGTADGVTSYTEDGRPVHGRHLRRLRTDEGDWGYHVGLPQMGKTIGEAHESLKGTYLDYRCIGMRARVALFSSPDQVLSDGTRSPREYTQEALDDGTYRVEARTTENGVMRAEVWYIDPRIGWNATRCESLRDGRVVSACTSAYQEYDGVWFPSHCLYTSSTGKINGSVRVLEATINSPQIPESLSPEIIGLVGGMEVVVTDGTKLERTIWDADRQTLVSTAEIRNVHIDPKLREIYDIGRAENEAARMGPPEAPAERAHQPVPLGTVEPAPTLAERELALDAWDKYTQDFILRYGLNNDQQHKAYRLLLRCKTARDKHLRKIKAQNPAKLNAQQLAKLYEPVTEIFEKRLKPGLMKIPTRAQRQAVEHPADQRPSVKPTTRPAKARP